jgi:hypothetical protein
MIHSLHDEGMSEGEYLSSIFDDCGTLEDDRADTLQLRKDTLENRYLKAKGAKVGERIQCTCGQHFTKKSYQQKFHTLKCKDRYWNTVDDTRRARAKYFNS